MRQIFRIALAWLALTGAALAQAQLGAGQIMGNSTAAQRPARAETVTAILDRALGSTRGAILERGASGWQIVAPSATVGLPWVSAGAGADPLYQALGAAGGGTGQTTYVLGDILYASGAAALSRLAGNTSTTKQYLSQTGNGTISAAPAWAAIAGADVTGAALTKTDDTNVTLTLGGTPATSLLRAASLTLGWTGTLAVARGGTNLASGTSGGVLYYSAAGTLASSGALGANQIVIGGGAGVQPSTFACGTATTVVHGGTPPTCSQVAIGADVSGLGTGIAAALALATNATGGLPTYTFGSWTPTFIGSTTAGTGQTYAVQVGSYEQVGRKVTIRFNLTASSLGTAAGNLQMQGLPLPTANVTSDNGVCWIAIYGVVGLAANNFSVTAFIPPNSSTITFLSNNNTSTANITIAQAGNNVTMTGSCVYRTT